MANRPGQKIKMTSIDELLCVPSTEGTTDIEVEAIYLFENHPFKVLDYEKMDELVESIKANVGFPCSLLTLISAICNHCGVTLVSPRFTYNDYEVSLTEDIDSTTCLSMISYIAQVSGKYARIGADGYLYLKWYDLEAAENILDGGSFSTKTTPYSDGDDADGGTFAFNDGDDIDGGEFTDDRPYQIYAMSSYEICTDDVLITGMKTEADGKEYLSGEEGYVLSVSNPLISAKKCAGDSQ